MTEQEEKKDEINAEVSKEELIKWIVETQGHLQIHAEQIEDNMLRLVNNIIIARKNWYPDEDHFVYAVELMLEAEGFIVVDEKGEWLGY